MSAEMTSAAPVTGAPVPTVAAEPPAAAGGGLALWIITISHGFNHLQGNM